jgi:hypothetical protein
METPGTVLAAKIIGWLLVAYFVVGFFVVLAAAASLGGYLGDVGTVGSFVFLVFACYFGIPILFLQAGRPAGRVVVIVLYSLAALVLLLLWADASEGRLFDLIPAAVCLTVVGVLCTPSASRWSALRPRGYLVAPPVPPSYGPAAFMREQGAIPFAVQHTGAAPFPPGPPQPPSAPPTAPPPTAPPPMFDEHGNPLPPLPPLPPKTPPGYRWQPPNYRG